MPRLAPARDLVERLDQRLDRDVALLHLAGRDRLEQRPQPVAAQPVGDLHRPAARQEPLHGPLLLEGVPEGLNLDTIAETITARVPGVNGVHHVHAWAITAEKPMLTLHASVDEPADLSSVMKRIKTILNEEFGIDHSTVQVDHGQCPDHR